MAWCTALYMFYYLEGGFSFLVLKSTRFVHGSVLFDEQKEKRMDDEIETQIHFS